MIDHATTRLLADRVLFIDAQAMVVDKPENLPVDGPRDGSISVASHLDMLRFGFVRKPLPVHRLDRDTSGCLLLARNPKAHRQFAAAFEAGEVTKTYLAILDGLVADDAGVVDMALTKVSTREAGWRMVPDAAGKPARTAWRRLAVHGGRTLIEMTPATGRTHQLRVHAASGIGVPIVGDPVYGRKGDGMMLHAATLNVPRAKLAPIAATAPFPPRFATLGFAP